MQKHIVEVLKASAENWRQAYLDKCKELEQMRRNCVCGA